MNPAGTQLGELSEKIAPLLGRAAGATWYEEPENDVDIAVLALCRLRRAGAGVGGSAEGGDAAVRDALAQADPGTILWVASRTISYMDEHGFPENLTSSLSGESP
jgi:hypothetical protein